MPIWNIERPHGKISQSLSAYGQPIKDMPSYFARFDAEAEQSASLWKFNGRFTPWVRGDVPYYVGGAPRKSRVFFEAKEGWLELATANLDFRVGNQLITWGAADVVNPLDAWNPSDMTDLFQAPKLPILAAKVSLHPEVTESFSAELIFTPLFRESRIPIEFPQEGGVTEVDLTGSRWLLGLPTTIDTGGNRFPLKYEISAPSFPQSWSAGGRLKFTRLLSWDFSLAAYTGVEKIPRIFLAKRGSASDPNLPITLTLNPSYHRESMLGIDGEGAVPDTNIGVRFEAAYKIRDNSRLAGASDAVRADLVKDNTFHGVLGLDYTFPKKFLWTVMYVNFMYVFFNRIGPNERPPGESVVQDLPSADPWGRNVVAYVENRIGSDYKLGNSVVWNHQKNDGIYAPAFTAQFTDALSATLGGELFFGPNTGFFGQFKDNRRIKLSASYSF